MCTCTFANEVYCICCSLCGLLYIGETKRKLGDRFVEHLCWVRDKRQHLPVTNHFNSPSNTLDDMSVLGLLQCHKNATRKLEEQHLIFCLGSLQPDGLNRMWCRKREQCQALSNGYKQGLAHILDSDEWEMKHRW
eukprot:g46463.t1